MYVLYRSYVGRVPENLNRDLRPRRHSPKTEEEDYNGLKREIHDSAQTPNARTQSKFNILLLCACTHEEKDGFNKGVQRELPPSTMISACHTLACPLQYIDFFWRGCTQRELPPSMMIWLPYNIQQSANSPLIFFIFFTFQRQPIHLSTLCTIHH
jgi:hypothetical protein